MSKELTRRVIALVSMGLVGFFSYLALVGSANLDVFWRVFGTLNIYVGWFFWSREREKNAERTRKSIINPLNIITEGTLEKFVEEQIKEKK